MNFFSKFPKSTNVSPKFVTIVDRQHLSANNSKSISSFFHRLSFVYVDVVMGPVMAYCMDSVKSWLTPGDKVVTLLRLTHTCLSFIISGIASTAS